MAAGTPAAFVFTNEAVFAEHRACATVSIYLSQQERSMDQQSPTRRPAIRAVSFEDVGAALARLVPIALPPTRAAETGASSKVADFLLAWWNGDDTAISRSCTFVTSTP